MSRVNHELTFSFNTEELRLQGVEIVQTGDYLTLRMQAEPIDTSPIGRTLKEAGLSDGEVCTVIEDTMSQVNRIVLSKKLFACRI